MVHPHYWLLVTGCWTLNRFRRISGGASVNSLLLFGLFVCIVSGLVFVVFVFVIGSAGDGELGDGSDCYTPGTVPIISMDVDNRAGEYLPFADKMRSRRIGEEDAVHQVVET